MEIHLFYQKWKYFCWSKESTSTGIFDFTLSNIWILSTSSFIASSLQQLIHSSIKFQMYIHGTSIHPIRNRFRNKRRNMWFGLCVSPWRPWFWPVYFIYYIRTIYYSSFLRNQNKLFLWDIHAKRWCDHDGVLDDVTDMILSRFLV